MKTCRTCGFSKDESEFGKDNSEPDHLNTLCKTCVKENKNKRKPKSVKGKICKKCKEDKSLSSYFHPDVPYCNICFKYRISETAKRKWVKFILTDYLMLELDKFFIKYPGFERFILLLSNKDFLEIRQLLLINNKGLTLRNDGIVITTAEEYQKASQEVFDLMNKGESNLTEDEREKVKQIALAIQDYEP